MFYLQEVDARLERSDGIDLRRNEALQWSTAMEHVDRQCS